MIARCDFGSQGITLQDAANTGNTKVTVRHSSVRAFGVRAMRPQPQIKGLNEVPVALQLGMQLL